MAAAEITVSGAKLWYGTEAEITALSATKGDVGYCTDTGKEYTNNGGTTWLQTRAHTNGSTHVTLATTLAGEDQTNDVLRVESQFNYETVAASQTGQVLGATGASGDYLHSVIVASATGTITVLDNATTVLVIPIGAVGVWNINAVSVSGAWKITTAAGSTCTCVGRFT